MTEPIATRLIEPGEDALLDELDALEASGQSLTKPGEEALLDELDAFEAAGESFTSPTPKPNAP